MIIAGSKCFHVDKLYLENFLQDEAVCKYKKWFDNMKSDDRPPHAAVSDESIQACKGILLSRAHNFIKPGKSILVFLPGVQEIHNVQEMLEDRETEFTDYETGEKFSAKLENLVVLQLHSG